MKVNFICDYCGGEGQKRPQHLNENKRLGHRNYCSRACMAKDRTHTLHTECGSCGVSVEKSLAQVKRSKSGKVFCSRSCASSYNNKHLKFGANHPNYDGGRSSYRERALRELGVKCRLCEYSIESVLEVHHIDRDRGNNEINNLAVLCPTHHREVHTGLINL